MSFAITLALVAMAPRSSRADADTERSAQQFFARGMTLRDEGKCQVIPVGNAAKCSESRDAFRRAYALNPSGLGVLRNLAYVERSLGLVTSAARHFRELARKAPLDPKPERRQWAKFAEEEANALEPRAPHLTVNVPPDRPADVQVYLDEERLPESGWGVPVDVDPGAHAIRAESAKVPTFAVSIDLAERESRSIDVVFPVPTKVPPPVELVPPGVTLSPEPINAPPAAAEKLPEPRPTQTHLTPLVVGGVGAVAVTVGLVAGVAARNARDNACDASTKLCEPDGLKSAHTLATVSTVFTLVGSVAVVVGLAWFIASPTYAAPDTTKKAQRPRLSPYLSLQGGGLVGTF